MSDRYWEAGNVPDVLLDWVNQNVVEAINDSWDQGKSIAWADAENGRIVLTVGGPEKPVDPTGQEDIYTLQFDVLETLEEFVRPYRSIGGPCSDEQREDMRERAAVLRKLAGDVAALAALAEKDG